MKPSTWFIVIVCVWIALGLLILAFLSAATRGRRETMLVPRDLFHTYRVGDLMVAKDCVYRIRALKAPETVIVTKEERER